ncbi:MAG: hypothetical protein JXM70_20930 [Pirellulales bacterium]|nr:hypothetical protein [Pirellulales bacterium]
MNEKNKILVGVLAATDALVRPMRKPDWRSDTPGLLYERRTAYHADGVPWRVSGGGGVRTAGARELSRLADDGLLILCGKIKRTGVRLTETGEHRARAMCGLPSLRDSHEYLGTIRSMEVSDGDVGPWASELWLAELDNYTNDQNQENALGGVQDCTAPSLIRGWVETGSDLHGRAYYRVTPAGRQAMAEPAPELPEGLPGEREGAFLHYLQVVVQFRRKLRELSPKNPSEIGYVPLSASIDLKRPKVCTSA